jgi:hypothetical protein
MALKAASDRLVVTLVKTRDTMIHATTIEVRLASGDVNSGLARKLDCKELRLMAFA